MGLLDFLKLRYHDETGKPGVHADPKAVTDIGRVLNNGTTQAVATNLIVCKRPALVFGFTCSSIGAQFIQLFDSASLPAEGAVPAIVFPVAATSSCAAEWIPPRAFQNGVVILASSTQHTKTIAVAADTLFDVQYV